MTQRITARKLECGDVRKIVARPEIEMIKKEDGPLILPGAVLTVVRSSVRRWKRGKTLTVNFAQKSGWVLFVFIGKMVSAFQRCAALLP